MSPLPLSGWPCLGVPLVPMWLQGQLLPALGHSWHIGSDPQPLLWQQSHTSCAKAMFTACCLLIFYFWQPWTSTVMQGVNRLCSFGQYTLREYLGVNSHHCVDFNISVLIYWCTWPIDREYNLIYLLQAQQHVMLQHVFKQESVGSIHLDLKQKIWSN